jgi:transcriptional regulator with XRE-family HTH domain
MKMKNLDRIRRETSPARRKRISKRAQELLAEEMTLGELRKAHELTQQRLAESLGIGQDQISKLEQRSDLLLSTLRSYIEAMGGKLTILAEFPKHKPVLLSGIAALENRSQ